MSATFIFLMVVLKIPIIGLLYIVWWAIHATPEPEPTAEDGGGGGARRLPHGPRPTRPRRPRRGPHGDPTPAAPPRTRTVLVKARRVES